MIKHSQQRKQPDKSPQKLTRRIFSGLTLISLLGQLFLLSDFVKFRERATASNIYIIPYSSFLWCLVSIVFNFIIRKFYIRYTQSFFELHLHPRTQFYSKQQKQDSIQSITRQSFYALYHLAVSTYMVVSFKDESWFPTWLGGRGTCNNMFEGYPSWSAAANPTMQIFVMIQLGSNMFHLLDLVWFSRDFFKDKQNGELLFHHVVGIILIFSGCEYNLMHLGITCALIHDLSDFFRAFSRVLGQSKLAVFSSKFTIAMDIIFLLMWGYLRVTVFPLCLINSTYESIPQVGNPFYFVYQQFICFIGLILFLFFLQVNWFLLLILSSRRQWKLNRQIRQHFQAVQNQKQLDTKSRTVEEGKKSN